MKNLEDACYKREVKKVQLRSFVDIVITNRQNVDVQISGINDVYIHQ
jgi:hypothetical protein